MAMNSPEHNTFLLAEARRWVQNAKYSMTDAKSRVFDVLDDADQDRLVSYSQIEVLIQAQQSARVAHEVQTILDYYSAGNQTETLDQVRAHVVRQITGQALGNSTSGVSNLESQARMVALQRLLQVVTTY